MKTKYGSLENGRPVLMILRTPPPYGGGEILCAALSKYVENDPEVLVLEIKTNNENKGNQGKFAFRKVMEFFYIWLKVFCAMRRERPSVVFCPMAKSFPHFFRDSILFWTARLFRIPFAGELAGATFYFLGKSKLQTLYGQLVLSRFVCLRVLGRSIALHLRKYGITNTIVSDNGIASSKASLQKDSNINGSVFHVLFVGTLSQKKGFGTLVEACINLANKGYAFEVHAMGEWISEQYKNDTEAMLRRNGMERYFIFHGLTHGKKKKDIFSEGQVLVLPSFAEGQPLVILEALSLGIPIVSTKVGGIPDTIIDGKNGFLIEPGDTSELEKKVAFLMESDDKRKEMCEANIALFKKRFNEMNFLKTQVYWIKQCARGNLKANGQFIKFQGELRD